MKIVIFNKENAICFERFDFFNHRWKYSCFNDLNIISGNYFDDGVIGWQVVNEKSILIKKEDLFDLGDVKFYLKTIIEILALIHFLFNIYTYFLIL
jgi:hypothetical protein